MAHSRPTRTDSSPAPEYHLIRGGSPESQPQSQSQYEYSDEYQNPYGAFSPPPRAARRSPGSQSEEEDGMPDRLSRGAAWLHGMLQPWRAGNWAESVAEEEEDDEDEDDVEEEWDGVKEEEDEADDDADDEDEEESECDSASALTSRPIPSTPCRRRHLPRHRLGLVTSDPQHQQQQNRLRRRMEVKRLHRRERRRRHHEATARQNASVARWLHRNVVAGLRPPDIEKQFPIRSPPPGSHRCGWLVAARTARTMLEAA